MRTRRRDRHRSRLSLRAGGPLLVGSLVVLITLGQLAAMAPTDPAAVRTSRFPSVNSSVVPTDHIVLTVAPEAGPTATWDATTPQTTTPLDLGSDAGSSSQGGLSNGHVAVIVIGSVLVVAVIAAALIGRRRRARS